MTDKSTKTSYAIKKLEEKDAEANNESARTNEILAGRGKASDEDPVAVSIKLNDPSLSRSAATTDTTGFNEDLERDADVVQSKALSKNK